MSGTDEERLARVAMACLVEPGTLEIYDLVRRDGPVAALAQLAAGSVPETLGAAVAARLSRADPRALAESVLVVRSSPVPWL